MFRKFASIFVPLVCLLAAGGCSELVDPAECPSGLICPAGTVCAAKQDICISDPCGNGIVDSRADEVCDDGNIIAGDGCSQDCKSTEECGDGVTDRDIGEVCDDNNLVSGDGCSADCSSNETCGNGIVDLDADEVCDDGNRLDGDGCLGTCRSTGECQNGVVDIPEECDRGGNTAECDNNCTRAYCGDEFVNEAAGEQCDTAGNTTDCDADCTAVACGDGFVNSAAGEQCEPPSANCSETCLLINCGDRVVDPGEDCDEGGVSTPTCDANCSAVTCGDGFLNQAGGEICDSGGNSVTCDADCTPRACGDGFVNPVAGEQCEAGAVHTATCDADCTFAVCGDSVHNPLASEACDTGGNSATCDGDCSAPQCSDGYLNTAAREECDDRGNTVACDADCTVARCGDGFLNTIRGEICDAGGQDTATCDSDCTLPVCGDDWWNPAANEQCDEAGNSSTCDQDCTQARCGDRFLNPAAGEICDDGNLLNNDECTAVCEPADCTDGFQNADELDVDCGGHCGPHSCEMLQSCSTSEDCVTGVCLGGTCVPGWSRLTAGGDHTCALLDTGAVRCWGYGGYGQLGYGNPSTIGDNEVPASVGNVNVGGTAIQLAAGGGHTCALLDTGTIRCWGYGGSGQLGYGNTSNIGDNETPASAGNVDVGGAVIQLTAGGHHTCALLDTGAVRCWGRGGYGQLGYGNPNDIGNNETPTSVGNVDVGGNVIQLAAGFNHTCALLDTGAVRCWGYGNYGQLGYGNTNNIGDNETPASAGNVNVGGNVIQLAAGGDHTCALLGTGAVRCWGYGYAGQLGYGNTSNIGDNETPASAGNVNVGGNVIQLAASGSRTCALLDSGAVRCWGYGYAGQLGYGNTSDVGDNETPASAGNVDLGGAVIQLATGGLHTCALLDTGAVRCWGLGNYGPLGYGNASNIGDNEAPASAGNVNLGDGNVIQLAAGGFHTCALLDSGAVRCWGDGNYGQLGYGNTSTIGDNETPASAGKVNLGRNAIQLAAGGFHTCALLDSGAVRCWGDGYFGQLGYGNTSTIGDNETPASAGNVNVGGNVIQLAAGSYHTCALLDTGAVRCWGSGGHGQLGYGNTNKIGDNETPASAGNVNVGGNVIQLAAGGSHTCALLDSGAVRCWGHGGYGQLGYGNTSTIGDNETPASAGNVNVGGHVIQLAAGPYHTCALLDSGSVRCWGYAYYGQLGYGNTTSIGDNETPASAGNVNVGGTVIQLAADDEHTCALLDSGNVRCWGRGGSGRLGYGNTSDIGDNEAPASAGNVNVGGIVIQLVAGYEHTCALLDTSAVRCWGDGAYGQLGYGNTSTIGDDEVPASAGNVPVVDSILPRAAGVEYNCALPDTSDARCWSDGLSGQIDHDTTSSIGNDETPASSGHLDVNGSIIEDAASFECAGALPDIDVSHCWSDELSDSFG